MGKVLSSKQREISPNNRVRIMRVLRQYKLDRVAGVIYRGENEFIASQILSFSWRRGSSTNNCSNRLFGEDQKLKKES